MATLRPDSADEKPLDPAVERVRARLVRFAVINIGILFVAVMVVLAAIVYKTTQLGKEPAAPAASNTTAPPIGEAVEGRIAIPAGARIVSQSLSGTLLSLQLQGGDGQGSILVFDTGRGRVVGRYTIEQGGN